MKFLNLVSLFFMSNCTSLPAPQSHLQKISNFAKNAYGDVRNYYDMAQEKLGKAKNYFMEKVKNIGRRGEPLYKEEEGEEPFPEMTEEELKKLFENLFKDMNLGDIKMDENDEEKKEEAEEKKEEAENDERAL